MSKTVVVTARVDPEILACIDEIAKGQDRTRAWILNKAVVTYADDWRRYESFVQEGLDAANRGELLSQDAMEQWFEARRRPLAAE